MSKEKIISRFTMKMQERLFTDVVTGKGVFEYKDKYGTLWMANYPFFPWSFRVKKDEL